VFRDDRRDVLASTRAALDYLTRLHGMFGDWHLALAAYNWGEGNVQRALRDNQRARRGSSYESLRMPHETRDYVPKLQAVKNIVADPERFGLALPKLENHPYFLSVPIARDIDVELAAKLAQLPIDEFRALNPQMNKPVILAAGTPQVLLPYDNANLFLRGLESHHGATASWTAWVAPKTLKPADAAKLAGMPEQQMREVNLIPPRMLVKAGSTLLVPRGLQATNDVSEHIADHGMLALAPEARAAREVRLKAGRGGDSVAAVAKRYRVSAAQVAQWNGVSPQARFKAGQTILVMLAPAPVRSAKAGHATRKVAKAGPVRKKAAAPKVRVAQR
jgi:membrane-bound lytic murein transglycosylase D